jgi:flagellar hook-associated protein 2
MTLEDPATYLTSTASSSNSTDVSASASSGAITGRYSVGVIQTAAASSNVINFPTIADTSTGLAINSARPFQIQLGTQTYSTNGGMVNGKNIPALSDSPTLSQLSNWINGLNLNSGLPVTSSIVQTTNGNYSLVVSGTKTGLTNNVTVSNTGSDSYPSSATVVSRDAIINVNGLRVQRSSNVISDVYDNNPIVFTLGSSIVANDQETPQANATITVGHGSDNSPSTIQSFISAFNSMISQYQSMVKNKVSNSGSTNGTFSNDSIMLSFIGDIKQKLSTGLVTGENKIISLSSIGIDMQSDGTLKFNPNKLSSFSNSTYANALEALASGVHLGGVIDNSGHYLANSSIADSLSNLLSPNGMFSKSIEMENADILSTQTKISNLQSQLDLLQKSYTAQYSALNSLLFNLSQASSQLTSSLAAVTNINSGK